MRYKKIENRPVNNSILYLLFKIRTACSSTDSKSKNVLGIIYQKLDFIFRVKPKTLVGHDDINVCTCVTL
ncbi:hypothetical protein Gasu2_41660 [Galdieria sulphuraria]|nr:hypothetical protein Gasu2_41660 [Galdieria sulphuraria]